MGFAFNLFVVFILLPITVLGVIFLLRKKKIFALIVSIIWISVIIVVLLVTVLKFFTDKIEPEKKDIYGQYVIDRTKFSGKQADWQYNHFRFEITEKNEFIFYLTENEKIIKVYKGTIEFLEAYRRPRIVLHMGNERHHIIEERPTLYRNVWSFYYVFHSPKFGNVFFKKGKWKPVDK